MISCRQKISSNTRTIIWPPFLGCGEFVRSEGDPCVSSAIWNKGLRLSQAEDPINSEICYCKHYCKYNSFEGFYKRIFTFSNPPWRIFSMDICMERRSVHSSTIHPWVIFENAPLATIPCRKRRSEFQLLYLAMRITVLVHSDFYSLLLFHTEHILPLIP